MEKIFTPIDNERMRIAADFRWYGDTTIITEGITQNLVALSYSDWLAQILDKWNERR